MHNGKRVDGEFSAVYLATSLTPTNNPKLGLCSPLYAPLATFLHQPQGCLVIFLSYFLALLIKVDAAGADGRSALADLLIAINVILALAVFLACWFTVQQTVESSRDGDSTILARTVQTAEQNTT